MKEREKKGGEREKVREKERHGEGSRPGLQRLAAREGPRCQSWLNKPFIIVPSETALLAHPSIIGDWTSFHHGPHWCIIAPCFHSYRGYIFHTIFSELLLHPPSGIQIQANVLFFML